MPLHYIKEAGRAGKIGLWHITEAVNELLVMKNFSHEDLSHLNSFSYEHRKKEWLVSRILAGKILGVETEIIYDVHSKPFLKNNRKHISLSHSHDLLAVIIDEKETGIDVEQIKPNVLRIKEKFMSEQELKALERGHKEEELTLYWCAKESLYKLYGKKQLRFKENLFVEPFEFLSKGKLMGEIILNSERRKYVLHYEKISVDRKDFILTFVLNE
jgi:phosphopantetheinyl transferase (holo-ACP synthase)